jgi:hypothetical protein
METKGSPYQEQGNIHIWNKGTSNGNLFMLNGYVVRGEEWIGETVAVEPVGRWHLRRKGVEKEVEGEEQDELAGEEHAKNMEG